VQLFKHKYFTNLIQPTGMNILVSAIITTHNRSSLLRRAIESVLNQTYKPIECIVVDDKSTDNTKEVCKEYPSIQFIYIPPEESKGGNYARNKGILAAKGEYVAFLDDDDYWLPEKTKEQMDVINDKSCEVVYCPKTLEEISSGNATTYIHESAYPFLSGDMRRKILYHICTTTSCLLVKRSALVGVGMFDENLKFWQEYELTIRLAQKFFFYYAWKDLVVYRVDISDKNRLTNKYKDWLNAVKYIHNKHKVLYLNLNLREKVYVKRLFWTDAIRRCNNSGLKLHVKYYRLLLRFSNYILKCL
jgi:glycosyltransferase involved in cell wall biosynthesis